MNVIDGGWDGDALKWLALIKHMIMNRLQPFTQFDIYQLIASTECLINNLIHGGWDSDTCKRWTPTKCHKTNPPQPLWKFHIDQSTAIMEWRPTNLSDRGWDSDTRKRSATRKCRLFNSLQPLAQFDINQLLAILECHLSNLFDGWILYFDVHDIAWNIFLRLPRIEEGFAAAVHWWRMFQFKDLTARGVIVIFYLDVLHT